MVTLTKTILVLLGENSRVVTFSSSSDAIFSTDKEAAVSAILHTFRDVLPAGADFFMQVKREEWGGVFVDLLDADILLDKSVVKAVTLDCRTPRSEVSRLSL